MGSRLPTPSGLSGASLEAEAVEVLPRLRRYASFLARDPDVAEELVQECYARALSRFQDGVTVLDVRPYLFTILHNLFLDRIARGRSDARVLALDDLAHPPSVEPMQGDNLDLRDLAATLDRLPPRQRQVLRLVALEGKSYDEAAAALDIPVGTVMSRLSRARAALRRALDPRAATQTDDRGNPA